jgi:RNA polymerase sigma-70 factor (ECF subfamily)
VAFETTRWSIVLAAGSDDTVRAREALATLCETYWYPLYAFIRRQGHDAEDARDLTQSFLASLLERRDFEGLHRERGRFRAFLLAAVKHFLANDAVHRRAQKRGGGAIAVTLEDAEGRYRHEPADRLTPEKIFDRRWALLVIERVLDDLRTEATAAGRAAEFDRLRACLIGELPPGGYARLAERLDSTEGAVKVAVHRLRRKFQDRLRQLIAETVTGPEEVDEEIRYLIRAVSQ